MSEQPELDLGFIRSEAHHRREGEVGGPRHRDKPADPEGITWRRVHTLERCHVCIAEQHRRLDGADGSPHAAWPASYVRTEGTSREALCFTHAAPRRAAEGLRAQRSTDPNAPKSKRRSDAYE